MRLLVASDLHGSPEAAAFLRRRCEELLPDMLVLLGDYLYHGPRNPLPSSYGPPSVVSVFADFDTPIVAVRGNCDAEVDQMVLDFPILADYALLYAGSRTVFATHGHHYNTACPPPLAKGDILLHGHTHVPAWQEFGSGNLYLNPGSVAIPKENSAHSYMMLTDSGFAWKDLEGSIYHTLALDCPNCG